jgi:septum formation protein
MVKLVLASNSPRRKKILSDMGLKYEIIPSNYDEKLDSDDFSYETIEDIATQKCLDVVRRVDKNSLVLAADTVVVLHNKILGKPHTKENAFKMLKELSGQTHMVVTSICAINTHTNRDATMSTTSYVRFTKWTDNMIEEYIDKYLPLDKAGSYGIQELPPNYLDKFEGSFENIVGLSPESVQVVLNQLGYPIQHQEDSKKSSCP